MENVSFDLEAVTARLLTQLYDLIAALPFLAIALVIVWIGWVVGGWISRRALLARVSRRNPLLNDVARTSTKWAVFFLSLLLALEVMDATAMVGALLGTAGVVGIAIGFAFKDTLENYLAGVLMSFRQPFAPKDDVVIDGEQGSVIALTSRATILMTPDGNHLRLPNAKVFRAVILNYTRNPTRRFEFEVGVGVTEDLLLAQHIGIEELCALEGVIGKPAPRAFIVSLGDSSVQVRFHGWVDQRQHDFWLVRGEAIRRVKTALESAGMDLPEPTYRLQVSAPAAASIASPVQRDEREATPARVDADSRPARTRPARGEDVPVPDTTASNELDEPIERDQRERGAENLLDDRAPKE